MTKVSVVIPVYNVEKYLRQCLDSVVNQTLKEIEVICVDDGSTDGSPAILAEYAAKDPRVQVLTRGKSNAGAARNAGMAVATGEFLAFVDSDDWCEPALYEKAVAKAERERAQIVQWGHDTYDEKKGGFTGRRVFPNAVLRLGSPFDPAAAAERVFADFPFAPWSRLIERRFAVEAGLAFQSVHKSNDVLFACVALAEARRMSVLDETLYHYRVGMTTNLQSSHNSRPEDVLKAWKGTADELFVRRGKVAFRQAFANAAVNSLFYTLNAITSLEAFKAFYSRLQELVAQAPFFASIDPAGLVNAGSRSLLEFARATRDPGEFLLWADGMDRRRYASLWWEMQTVKAEVARANRELQDVGKTRAPGRQKRRTSSLLAIVGPASAEARNRAIEEGESLYVAFPGPHDRYVSPNVAEILALSAEAAGAHVCGGYGELGSHVFERAWLRKTGIRFSKDVGARTFLRRALEADSGGLRQDREVVATLLEGDVVAEVAGAEVLSWAEETLRKLFAADRLDLVGRFYVTLRRQVVAHDVDRRAVGALMNRFGYPFLESLLPEMRGRAEALRDLRTWANAASGLPVADFRNGRMPSLGGEPFPVLPSAEIRLSVIVPVYNVEAYLVRAIESVRKQGPGDWELICVDDGSTDRSPAILDYYAAQDRRIRVIHKPNTGVSDTRNLGLAEARGRYVLFLDGDDWYEPGMFRDVLRKCLKEDLDLCFFDFQCRHYATLEKQYHFWTFDHLFRHWGVADRVFSSRDLGKWWFYGSLCQMAWKRSFLREHGAKFPAIPLGEDVALMCALFPFVRRAYVLNTPYYNYQRGNPTSAVSRHGAEKGEAFVRKYETLLEIYRTVYGTAGDADSGHKFIGRILADITYDCKVAPRVAEWMREVGIRGFGLDNIDATCVLDAAHLTALSRIREPGPGVEAGQPSARDVPGRAARLMKRIEAARARSGAKTLYLVAAQLASLNDEAIDGWSFFLYLRERGVEAKFVMPKAHRRYAEFRAAYPGDVIGLDHCTGRDYDFLYACADELVRAKAVALEWPVSNPVLDAWLSGLEGCSYVFLQHGVTFNPPRPVHRHWWKPFNVINFCSERERDMVMPVLGERAAEIVPVVAGLPRWDLLSDSRASTERTVLVMFTWRPTFNVEPAVFADSAYYRGLRALLSAENVGRLRKQGLKLVLSLHHALRSIDSSLMDFGEDVQIVSPQEVSQWIRRAACLVTDFSSVAFDFWYQRKPVVYWMPDRFDETLSAADREKVKQGDAFLAGFVNQVDSAQAAVDKVLEYAGCGFALDAGTLQAIRPFFSEGGDFRERIYNAVEEIGGNVQ